MIYKLKKDNYKNFNVFAENLLTPRAYFIPFSDSEELDKTDIRTERYNSSRVAVLSGEWNFKYYSKVSEMPDEFDTDNEDMDTVQVPSMWQYTGYERPYYVNQRYQFNVDPPNFPEDCPVAVYSKKFIISDTTGNFSVAFLGVAGSLDVFVNGNYVGYSEGSHNTAEFDITPYLADGENEIAAIVHKWCNGTYIEAQDMFRNNGIFRDVLIYRTGDNSIYDFEANITYNQDGSYMLDVIPQLKLKSEVSFNAVIKDNNKIVAEKTISVCPGKTDKITFDVLDVEEWSAEIPKLYDLYISLSDSDETEEIIRKKIGFRHVEIRKNIFYFNNKRIKLLGVNHHDTTAKAGYVMTMEDLEKDIKIFKEYNVNCVRTSHYPPDPVFIELCDEYGIYVVDEADIEAHGVCCDGPYRPNLISNNLQWKEHYWDRVNRMFQRDKNSPSITMWSLGNEAGGIKCQDYCYKNLKELTAIPIHYEGATRTRRFSYDVHSEMYPAQPKCEKVAAGRGLSAKYYEKPFFLCEYAHAMGVGAGDLERYVKAFYSSDIMMGGCIWEFADHAVYHENGDYKYTYGGDHGEWKHDGNFCVDGLFNADRTPHAGAVQMKNCYRPIRAKHKENHRFEFTSKSYFKTQKCVVKYSVLNNGIEAENGEFELEIEPTRTVAKEIEYSVHAHTVIVFNYFDGEKHIAREQIVLSDAYKAEPISESDAPKVSNSERKLFISTDKFEIVYNTANCVLESYIYNGKQLFNQNPLGSEKGFNPELYRAPLDNDMYLCRNWHKKGIDKLAFESKKQKEYYHIEDNAVVLNAEYKLVSPKCRRLGKLLVTYKIHGNGEIQVDYCYRNLKVRNVPRLGITLEMPKNFSDVKYFGYDMLTLSDFKEHSVFAVSELKVSDMHEVYVKPQESGMRYNTYWAELTDADGAGLRFESENSFVFDANHFNVSQWAKAAHAEDLKEYETTAVHIDGYMLGAGSNACGPAPFDEHKKTIVSEYENSFTVKPIGNQNV